LSLNLLIFLKWTFFSASISRTVHYQFGDIGLLAWSNCVNGQVSQALYWWQRQNIFQYIIHVLMPFHPFIFTENLVLYLAQSNNLEPNLFIITASVIILILNGYISTRNPTATCNVNKSLPYENHFYSLKFL
jgi:hypothetical protein